MLPSPPRRRASARALAAVRPDSRAGGASWTAPATSAESWKASLAHSKGHFVDILIFTLVASAINFVGAMFCGLGLLISVPVTLAATWLFYAEQRDQILELARRDGVGLLPG